MSKKLAIKGHPTRGKEVIELLEMIGGDNRWKASGNIEKVYYSISNGSIIYGPQLEKGTVVFTLDEFYKKYPFKVGDKVVYTKFGDNCDDYPVTIESMKWTGTTIEYTFNDCVTCLAKDLKIWNEDNCQETSETEVFGYKVDDVIFTNDTGWIRITNKLWDCFAEEYVYEGIGIISEHEHKNIHHHSVTGKMELEHLKHCKDADEVRHVNSITDDIMINQITNKVSVIKLKPDVCDDKIELQLEDYEIEVRDGRTYAVKKKPKYPKTYEECWKVRFDVDGETTLEEFHNVSGYYSEPLGALQKLLCCRDAYWKIAGEEMGLDRHWKPDWTNCNEYKYCLYITEDVINKGTFYNDNKILSFPTGEIRDTFYENFKDLIKQCKELL